MYSMCVLVGLIVSVQAQGYGFNSYRGQNRGYGGYEGYKEHEGHGDYGGYGGY